MQTIVSLCLLLMERSSDPLALMVLDIYKISNPTGVAVNGILAVDGGSHRIQKFTADGQFLTAVGTKSNDPLEFSAPKGIAVNRSNNKYSGSFE